MNISRIEPWGLVNLVHRDLGRISARHFARTDDDKSSKKAADWIPAIDIVEEKDQFVLLADLPGVKPGDIDVSMEKGVLSISGRRSGDADEDAEMVQKRERNTGVFYRQFTLPESANGEEISATSDLGTLKVIIAKQPQVESRRITVNSA